MYYVLLIYPFALLGILLYESIMSGKGEYNRDFLSQKQAKSIQAFACIGIMLHHMTQQVTSYGDVNRGPITIFAQIGILFTSVFFFFSGYGLIRSYYTKDGYLRSFVGHRIPKVIIPFFTANSAFVLARAYELGHFNSITDTVLSITGVTLINSNGWYIIEIVVLYLAFYFLFSFFRNKDISLCLLIVFSIWLIFFTKSRGHDFLNNNAAWFRGEWWYNSTIVFSLGLLFGRFRESVERCVKKHYHIFLGIFLIIIIPTYLSEEYFRKAYGYYNEVNRCAYISNSTVTLIWQMLLCIVSTCLILLINLKISFSNKLLSFVGKISLELFLIHKLPLNVIFGISSINVVVKYFAVIVSSIILAWILNFIDRAILIAIGKVTEVYGNACNAIKTRDKKKTRKALFLVCIVSIILFGIFRIVIGYVEFSGELSSLENASIGDTVLFGHFDTDSKPFDERLEWIVVDKDNDTIILLSKLGIASGSVLSSHSAVKYTDSDLRMELNSEKYLKIFSSNEKKYLLADENGDLLSLLSVDEARKYFSNNEERILRSSEVALIGGVNANRMSKMNRWDYDDRKASWWWLKSDESSIMAPIVSVDGEIILNGEYVNKSSGAIRPVVIVCLGK